jgi:3-oxoacyl-[acyl-carrier-protein] synthase II
MNINTRRQSINITGVGAVTAYGWGREALWTGLASGKPAAQLTAGFGKTSDESGWVATIPSGGDLSDGSTRFARAMRWAARDAIEDAYARGWTPGKRVGLVHATVLGDLELGRAFQPGQGAQLSIREYLGMAPSTPASTLMKDYGFHGPAVNVSAMCTSGTVAILTAKMWLDNDIVDDVLVLSTDLSATPEVVSTFVRLGVAITDAEPLDACRPFQEDSRGFVFGEAAVGFVMSKQETDSYLNVLGGAMSHDGFHVTSVDPSLAHVKSCFTDALADADVAADQVRYLNAHGPGTKQCDAAEAATASALLPADVGIYSVKPLAGHCQAAAAAVEIAAVAMSFTQRAVPATPTVAKGDPRLVDGLTPATPGITLKSSLGMGGHNSVTVLAPPTSSSS